MRDRPHDRAQREHAPCKSQRGDHRGCDRKKGRATMGATRLAPPPPAEGPVPRLVPAPCSRRAYAKGQAARKPPPPHPLLLHPPTKEARTARRQRGDVGGRAEYRPKRRGGRRVTSGKKKKQKTKDTNAPEEGQTAGADGTRQEPESTARSAGKGDAPGEGSREAGTNTAANGGAWGGKSPQKTLVGYPTSGVWGPPRCPYRPHLSAGNKVGYARDRWPPARGGTGLGGWPMGLTKSTPHGTYCGSCPVRGCG